MNNEDFEKLKSHPVVSELAKLTSNVPKLKIPTELLEAAKILGGIAKSIQEKMQPIVNAIQQSNIPNVIQNIAQNIQKNILYQYEFRQKILEQWSCLEKELKTQNRYFLKSELVNLFEKFSNEAKYVLRNGSVLYRARKIEAEDISCKVKNIIDAAMLNLNKYELQKGNVWQHIENIPIEEWNQYEKNFPLEQPEFWGFDAKKSDAPPSKNSMQGRVNPIGISYLYVARNIDTAIAEIQPTIEQTISVAKIKTLRKLKLFSFEFSDVLKNLKSIKIDEAQEQIGISFWELQILFDTISELFSKPALGNQNNYYVTQYLSEFIKHLGFDGIKYKSSLKKGGSNIVLFDISKDENDKSKNYDILSSSLHRITNVKVTSNRILPRNSVQQYRTIRKKSE